MLINILNVRWKDEATKNLFGIDEILQIIINASTKNLHIQGSMHMYSTPYTGMTCVNGYFDYITAAIKTPTNGYCAIKIESKFDDGIVEVNDEIFVSEEFTKRCERFNHNLTSYVCAKNQENDKQE